MIDVRKIRKLLLTCAVICLALIGLSVPVKADEGGYTITDYRFQGTLHENNVMDVKETITVNFTEPRHGIYRYIDTCYSLYHDTSPDGDGSEISYMTYYADVTDFDVRGYAFEEDDDNSDSYTYCARIGDEDETVSGIQTYEISYRYVMRDDRIDNSDFFFYSVLGSGWETDIDQFSFEIDFDEELPDYVLEGFQIYSGAYGDESNDLNVTAMTSATKITGEAWGIGPNQAISLYMDLPEGYFTGEKTTSPLPFRVCLVLSMIFTVFILILELVKKDKKVIVTVEFYPPDGLSPAEIGTIVDESVDDRDVLAMIPYWADQGYLSIRMGVEAVQGKNKKSNHEDVALTKLKELPEDAPLYQKNLFAALFEKGNTVKFSELGEKFVKELDKVKNDLRTKYDSGEHQLSTGSFRGLFLCSAACLFFGLALAFSSQADLLENIFCGVLAFCPLGGIAFLRVSSVSTDRIRSVAGKVLTGAGILCLLLIALFFTDFAAGTDSYLSKPVGIAGFALIAAAVILSGNLVHATEYKKRMIGKVLGLRQFIQTAEIPRLEMLMQEDPEYFYHVLPYAMAFDLSDQWAALFKDLNLTRPSWYYYNEQDMLFDAVYFNHCFHAGVEHSISVTRSEISSSSSSSGGGFSGGGGGGGGGGSW